MSDKQNLPAHEGNDLPSVSIRRPVLIVHLRRDYFVCQDVLERF